MSQTCPRPSLARLHDVVKREVELPQFLFSREFDEYRFFDADISTSDGFVDDLQGFLNENYGAPESCDVFLASGLTYLGSLNPSQSWAASIPLLARELSNQGDCGGLILFAETGKWIAVQSRPVDVGVLAFNDGRSSELWRLEDSFFGCEDIAEWLEGSSDRDEDLRTSFGVQFLAELLRNYCDRSLAGSNHSGQDGR